MRYVIKNRMKGLRYRLLLVFIGMALGRSFGQAPDCSPASIGIESKEISKSLLFGPDECEITPIIVGKDTFKMEHRKSIVIIDTIIDNSNHLGDNVMIKVNMPTPLKKEKKRSLSWAIKTNLLYAATLTPNLGLEVGVSPKMSLNITGGYNPWNREGKKGDNDKWVHWMVQPELRYWFCETTNGHFIGIHGIATKYNIGGHKLFNIFDKDYRYEGWGVGAGFTYGYSWLISKRWAIEAFLGVGIVHLDFDKTDNRDWCCGESQHSTKTFFGPTKIGISLIYNIK